MASAPMLASRKPTTSFCKVGAQRREEGLFAECNLASGDVIVRNDEPLVAVLRTDQLSQLCYYCFQFPDPGSKLRLCTACRVPRYCSKTCQSLSWSSEHKYECKILKKVTETQNRILPTPVRALIQSLGALPQQRRTGVVELDHLLSHRDDFAQQSIWEDIQLQSQMAHHLVGGSDDNFERTLTLFCQVCQSHRGSSILIGLTADRFQIKTNAFRITHADGTDVGLCFEPALALANHSCTPNAFVSFDGRRVTLRALQPIVKGEEVFISYVGQFSAAGWPVTSCLSHCDADDGTDTTQPTFIRQSELKQRYCFECSCARCKHNLSSSQLVLKEHVCVDSSSSFGIRTTTEIFQAISDQRRDLHEDSFNTAHDLFNELKKIDTPAQRVAGSKSLLAPVWADSCLLTTSPYPDVLHDVYLTYLTAGEYAAACAVLAHSVVLIDDVLFSEPWHPTRVAHYVSLAKLLKLVALDDTGRPHAEALSQLTALPAAFERSVDFGQIIYVLLRLADLLVDRSHGAESRFAFQVRAELFEAEHHVSEEVRKTTLVGKVVGTADRERLTRLAQLAAFAPAVIGSVDLLGGGKR